VPHGDRSGTRDCGPGLAILRGVYAPDGLSGGILSSTPFCDIYAPAGKPGPGGIRGPLPAQEM